MEISEIKKMCLCCMHMSKEDEFCPVCGKPKKGVKSYGEALEPGTILNGKILIGNILGMGNFGITYIGIFPFGYGGACGRRFSSRKR